MELGRRARGHRWFSSPSLTGDLTDRPAIEFAVLDNGTGPTALLLAGMHGDEFEGQIALLDLIRQMTLSDLAGRLIVVPRANRTAAERGARLTPHDGGDLNRSFPGRADGTLTERIAHYIATVLLPQADYVLDLHAGGRDYVSADLAWITFGNERAVAAARAFGAPFTLVAAEPGAGTLAAAASRKQLYLATDTVGSAFGAPASVRLLRDGVQRVLQHLGVLEGARARHPPSDTRFMRIVPGRGELRAPQSGLFEPVAEVGEEIAPGQVVARVHGPNPDGATADLVSPVRGVLLGRVPAGPVVEGQRVGSVAEDWEATAPRRKQP